MTAENPRRVHLVDGSGLFFRAHFAFINRPLTTSSGMDVGATFGFVNTLLALLRDEGATHLAVAFDSAAPTFRHERYPQYKATRPPMPEELIAQVPWIHRTVEALGLRAMLRDGVEADDLIGSAARAARAAGWETVIVSADKDFAQLIEERIVQYVPSRGREPARWLDGEAVRVKWGVTPEQFVDYLALVGDSSDNIPGVKGIGAKTAAKLLESHPHLEAIYDHLEAVTPAGVRAKLEAGREAAFLSRELVTIRTDLETPDPADLTAPDPAAREPLRALLEELEFKQIARRLFSDPGSAREEAGGQLSLAAPRAHVTAPPAHGGAAVADGWDARYGVLASRRDLERVVAAGSGGAAQGVLAIDTETDGLDVHTSRLVGLSFGWTPGDCWYVPVQHQEGPNLPLPDLIEVLGPLLKDPAVTLAGQNLKFDAHVLARHGLPLEGPLRDTMVASYLRDPDARHGLDALARELLGHTMVPIEALIGAGRDQISMAAVPVDVAAPYACEDVDAVLRLLPPLQEMLRAGGATELFEALEMPLLPILTAMERHGVLVDGALLGALGESLAGQMERLEARIHRLAGQTFNVNSTKQLQKVLFEDLKLHARRRTKTGYSTGQEVLEELAATHPLPAAVLEYRQLAKLRGTYVEALPKLIRPDTGRIHTEFHQTVTATGRLSSSNPNLQNIPIRTPLGREIRKAFIAPPGHRIVSADYSQIELRLLAHLSQDDYLVEAFRAGADIHRATAARVFNVAPGQVDPAMRARAKVVNFGVLYGMGAQRLAREQGIAVKEASAFIGEYFEKLPGVKAFIDRSVAQARERGYAATLLGRRRRLPDLNSPRPQLRAAAERMAVNTPVQGSAADLIKLAMVRIHAKLAATAPSARMLLQVHDELVFEVSAAQERALEALVAAEMTAVMELRVPLQVDISAGANWYEAHA